MTIYISFIYVKNTWRYNIFVQSTMGFVPLSMTLSSTHYQLLLFATPIGKICNTANTCEWISTHKIYEYMSLSPEQATNKHQKMNEEKEIHLTCSMRFKKHDMCMIVTISLILIFPLVFLLCWTRTRLFF